MDFLFVIFNLQGHVSKLFSYHEGCSLIFLNEICGVVMWSREQQELDIAVDLQMQKGQKMLVFSIFTLVFWAFWREKEQ